ncbi:hypothetical protein MXB_5332 [Myxobolus squamalis]|nr:hypothetical protein MXB_5332 [Myxobolus squamalis]
MDLGHTFGTDLVFTNQLCIFHCKPREDFFDIDLAIFRSSYPRNDGWQRKDQLNQNKLIFKQ